MIIFKSKQKKFESDLKIKLYVKRVYPTETVNYQCEKIDHLNNVSIKLNRANALFFKVRKHVSLQLLRSIYFAFF